MGAHILAIKDMAGLCKPYAAEQLVRDAQAGDRHPDPLPHARHQRRAGRRDSQGRRSRPRHRRRRHGPDVGPDLAAESELGRRGAAVHAARHGPRLREPAGDRPLLGSGPRVLRAVRDRHDGQHGRRLHQRDARRPVHEPVSAGPGRRPGRALARHLPHVRRRESALRRHRQGHARRRRPSATWRCF